MSNPSDRELMITRRFHAPRDLVFDAWTRSEVLDRWMGPSGFTTTTRSFDFRVGGEWWYTMQHPEYGTFPNRVRFIEIAPGHRIVYDHDTGEEGGPDPFRVTVTFTDQGEYTELTMRTLFGSVEEADAKRRMGAETFGGQTLGKLAAVLEEGAAATS